MSTVKSRHHMARVRSIPCLICEKCGLGDTPAEAHHVFDSAARSDWLTIPLCRLHHQGPLGFHGLGQRAFERKYHTTEAELLAMTLERFGVSAYSPDEIRTLEQNKKFHAMVRDIAAQVEWAGERMEQEDWKRLLLAAKYGQRVVPNPLDPHGAFVVANLRRSRALTVAEMSEFLAEIEAFGAERGVDWSDDE